MQVAPRYSTGAPWFADPYGRSFGGVFPCYMGIWVSGSGIGPVAEGMTYLNEAALRVGSTFYEVQPRRRTRRDGVTYCPRSKMIDDIPPIKRHEGFSADDHNSHSDVFRRSFETLVRVPAERLVLHSSSPDLAHELCQQAHQKAAEESDRIADGQHTNNCRTDCEFNFNPAVRFP